MPNSSARRKRPTVAARIATAKERAQAGRLAEALDVLEELGEYKTAQGALKELRRTLETRLIETLLEDAQSAIQGKKYGHALAYLMQVLEEDSGHQQALELTQRVYKLDPGLPDRVGGDVPTSDAVTETTALLDRIDAILGPEAKETSEETEAPETQTAPPPTEVVTVGGAGGEARELTADAAGLEETEEAVTAESEGEALGSDTEPQVEAETEVEGDDLSQDSGDEAVDLPLRSTGGEPDHIEPVKAKEDAPEVPEAVQRVSSSVPKHGEVSTIFYPSSSDPIQPPRRRTWQVWLGGLVVLVLLVGFVFGVLRIKEEAFRSTKPSEELDKPQVLVSESPSPSPQEDRVEPSEVPPTVGTPPPKPEMLTLVSHPPNAQVFLDGKLAGTTPLDIEISEDQSVEVEVKLEGHRPELGKLSWSQLTENQKSRREFVFRLQPLVRPGELAVSAGFPVRFFVDDVNRGVTSRLKLSPGTYKVRLEAPDVFYKSEPEVVRLDSGETHALQIPQVVELQVGARPSNCEVTIDGIPVGPLPISGLKIATGLHRFKFVWPELGESKTEDKSVRPDSVRIEGVLGAR